MEKYNCKNCEHNKAGNVMKRNKHCEHCTIDSKDLFKDVKPSQFKEKQ